jgi:hypothetical protein
VEATRFEELAGLMGQMAAGDPSGAFTLYEEFGATISMALRGHLARSGVRAVAHDDLDGLVIEACLELYGCAAAWDPTGGALPWVWAERRLAGIVRSFVGQHADELDAERVAGAGALVEHRGPAAEADTLTVLDRLAGREPVCHLLREALGTVGSERDRAILLEIGVQAGLGDRSPAVTVASMFGMRPDAVRQVVRRMRIRLRRLASDDDRYAPLTELALLA